MKNNPLTSNRPPRTRFHITEEVLAQLDYTRRSQGYGSWDQLFRAMLCKWNEAPVPLPEQQVEKHFKKLEEELAAIHAQLNFQGGRLETLQEEVHTLEIGQEQAGGYVQRLAGFLELAFELAGDKKRQEPVETGLSPEEEAAFRKIRNRELS